MLVNWWMDNHMALMQQNSIASWHMGGTEEHHTGKKPVREATDCMTVKRKTKEHMADKGIKESFPSGSTKIFTISIWLSMTWEYSL